MIIPDYRVEPADFKVDYDDLHTIRESVFILEQNIPVELEFDETDPLCTHAIARDNQNLPIGTGRLSPEGKLGRLAVLTEWRGQGVGSALLEFLMHQGRKMGLKQITLNAQTSAIAFYNKMGFTAHGDDFNVAGIPHRKMIIELNQLEPFERPINSKKRESIAATKFDSMEKLQDNTLDLISQARRHICIFTRDLEPNLYGDKHIIEALKKFTLQNRMSTIQIILLDTESARINHHPILSMVQRLPSSFFLRTPIENDDLQYPSAFLANDNGGYLFRLFGDRNEGEWSINLPSKNRQINETFEAIWQRSKPCTEFRILGI